MSKTNNKKILDIDTDSSIDVYTDKVDSKKVDSKKIDSKKDKQNTEKRKPNSIKDSNYIRPPLTYTDKLTKKDIEALLIDYEEVDDLKNVPQGSYIRYFEDKDGVMKFRTGGILTIKSGLPTYIILYNNKVSWSVQVKRCLFFRKITIVEVKQEYKELLDTKDRQIAELQSLVKELTKKNNILKQKLINKPKK